MHGRRQFTQTEEVISMTRFHLSMLVLTLWFCASDALLADTAVTKPNVVFILADDLGWSDTTLYGTTKFYQTPHIERLAQRGMTFTRAYSSSPLCSPTRASILTGLSPARHGITSPNCHLPKVVLKVTEVASGPPNAFSTIPDSVSRLDTRYATLAEMFQGHGYATGHFGKWHLGSEPYSPLEHGFDVDVPHHPGPGPAGSYVAPWKFKDFDHDPDVPDEHIEDRMAKEAVAFIEKHQNQPFFLNYWMFSVHAPFDAKQSLIEKYKQTVDPQDPQRSPTYAAMVESMDDAVGTLLDTLDRLEIAENTIIIFTSDNGGNMYNEVDGTTPTSNAPLRGGKATMYEGGIRVPCVVCYPGLIEPNSRSDAIIQSVDFYPTLLDLLGLKPGAGQKFDGVSFIEALQGSSRKCDPIFTYFPHRPGVPDWLPPSVSVHDGDMKLIRIFHGGPDGAHRWKLFNLHADIGEQNDLSAELPNTVRRLDKMIDSFLADTKAAVPRRNPRFDPSKYDPALEGISRFKSNARNSRKPAGRAAKAVAGWQPGGTCRLSVSNGVLHVHSDGRDPFLSFRLPDAIEERSLTLHVSMASESSGKGQVFWLEKGVAGFSAERRETFDVRHDGQKHDYAVSFRTMSSLLAVRIDPSNGRGTIRIHSMRLTSSDGKTLYRWSF